MLRARVMKRLPRVMRMSCRAPVSHKLSFIPRKCWEMRLPNVKSVTVCATMRGYWTGRGGL